MQGVGVPIVHECWNLSVGIVPPDHCRQRSMVGLTMLFIFRSDGSVKVMIYSTVHYGAGQYAVQYATPLVATQCNTRTVQHWFLLNITVSSW